MLWVRINKFQKNYGASSVITITHRYYNSPALMSALSALVCFNPQEIMGGFVWLVLVFWPTICCGTGQLSLFSSKRQILC